MFQDTLQECLAKDSILSTIKSMVIARDELPDHVDYPTAIIINTKPRDHNGEHWLAIYFNSQGEATFFDSYGKPPSFYNLESFLTKSSTKWSFNNKRIQGSSYYCGYYSLLFLLFKSRNMINSFYSKFTNNYNQNDNKLTSLINSIKKLK